MSLAPSYGVDIDRQRQLERDSENQDILDQIYREDREPLITPTLPETYNPDPSRDMPLFVAQQIIMLMQQSSLEGALAAAGITPEQYDFAVENDDRAIRLDIRNIMQAAKTGLEDFAAVYGPDIFQLAQQVIIDSETPPPMLEEPFREEEIIPPPAMDVPADNYVTTTQIDPDPVDPDPVDPDPLGPDITDEELANLQRAGARDRFLAGNKSPNAVTTFKSDLMRTGMEEEVANLYIADVLGNVDNGSLIGNFRNGIADYFTDVFEKTGIGDAIDEVWGFLGGEEQPAQPPVTAFDPDEIGPDGMTIWQREFTRATLAGATQEEAEREADISLEDAMLAAGLEIPGGQQPIGQTPDGNPQVDPDGNIILPGLVEQFGQYSDGGEIDYSGFDPNQLRTYQEAAMGELFNTPPETNIAPGLVGRQRDRASEAARNFQLQAALGGFGVPGITPTNLTLGGNDVQQLVSEYVAQALSQPLGERSMSFRELVNMAEQAYSGTSPGGQVLPEQGQYSDINRALGFTNAADTRGAYGGFVDAYINPVVGRIRGPMGNMLRGQIADRERNLYDNPETQMADNVNPAAFLRYIMEGF